MGIFVFEDGYRRFWGIDAFAPCRVIGDYYERIGGPFLEVFKGDLGFCFGVGLDFWLPTSWPVIDPVPAHSGICRGAPVNGYLCGVRNCGEEKNGTTEDKTRNQ
jgi:hypothetical protein